MTGKVMTHGKENQPCFFFCDLTDKKESFISTYPNMFLGLTPIPRSYYGDFAPKKLFNRRMTKDAGNFSRGLMSARQLRFDGMTCLAL